MARELSPEYRAAKASKATREMAAILSTGTPFRSNRLTVAELDAVIGVAGDALASETLADPENPEVADAALEAFESGMEKLRRQLAARRRR